MARLYIVRHGQADSLGTHYDQLTELGFAQARMLGDYLHRFRLEFDFVACGTLQRQNQTLDTALGVLKREGHCLPPPVQMDSLNEFDSRLWMHISQRIEKEDSGFAKILNRYRSLQSAGRPSSREVFQVLIQRVLQEWVSGFHNEPYSFDIFSSKVLSSLNRIPEDAGSILLVTSATPVAVFSGHSLKLDKVNYIPLMKHIHNTSLNVFEWSGGVLTPITINSYPHIQNPDFWTLL